MRNRKKTLLTGGIVFALAVALCPPVSGEDVSTPVPPGIIAREIISLLGGQKLPQLRFEVPLGVFREISRLEKLGILPPVPFLVESQTHKITIDGEAASLDVSIILRVFDHEGAGLIPLLTQALAFHDIKVNGEAARLAPIRRRHPVPHGLNTPAFNNALETGINEPNAQDEQSDWQQEAPQGQGGQAAPQSYRPDDPGWLGWKPPAAGVYTITAHAPLKPVVQPSQSRQVQYPRCLSARADLVVESKGAWEVKSEAAGRIVGDANGTNGRLALRAGPRIIAWWREPLPITEHEPVLTTTCDAACDFAPAVIAVRARINISIARGRTDQLVLELPPGADRVSVEGPDVRRVDGAGAERTVNLRGPILGRTVLSVVFEVPRPPKGRLVLDYFGIRGATPAGGHLLVSNSAGGELLEEEADRLEEEALFGLPDDLLALSSEKPLVAYSMKRGQWRLVCDLVLASEVPMPPTLIDSARYSLVYRADGDFIGKARFDVRNSNRQFLRVRLPRDARILVAIVDQSSVSITPGGPGEFILPLTRSIATLGGLVSFPVEIVYAGRGQALGRSGEFRALLPRVDAPIAHATCSLHLPDNIRFTGWRGALKQVDLFTTEREHTTMVVGRGYRVETTTPSAAPATPAKAALGDNYYRAGLEAYNKKDFASAAEAFQKVIDIAPKSTVAANARDLLRNTMLALGRGDEGDRGKSSGRVERAQKGQISRGFKAGDDDIVAEQKDLLRRGEELAKQGQSSAAAEVLAGAIVLGEELRRRGQGGKEQEAIISRAREQLARQTEQQKKAIEVTEKYIAAKQATRELQKQAKDIGGPTDDIPANVFGADSDGDKADKQPDEVIVRRLEEKKQVVAAIEKLAEGERDEPEKPADAKQPQPAPGIAGKRILLQRARQRAGRADIPANQPLRDEMEEVQVREREAAELSKKLEDLKQQTSELKPATRAKEEQSRERAAELLKQADAYLSSGDIAAAANKANEALRLDPDNAEATEMRKKAESAMVAQAEGRHQEQATRRLDGERGPAGATDTQFGLAYREYAPGPAHTPTPQRETPPAPQHQTARMEGPKVSIDFVATPLDEVVAFFRGVMQTNIVVDRQALVGRDNLDITLKLDNLPARDALRWALNLVGMDYAVRDGAIFITAKEKVAPQGQVVTKFYDVTDLTVDVKNFRGDAGEFERDITRILADNLKANTWSGGTVVTNGTGVITPTFALDNSLSNAIAFRDGKLIVTHTPEVQENIRELIANVKKNWGQKVKVNSFNVMLPQDTAGQAGVTWNTGTNGVTYSVVDEGQVRTLVELSQKQQRTAIFAPNPMANDAIVGTNALVANNDWVNVEATTDRGNKFNYMDNSVFVPHNRYLLISNGGTLTVVGGTQTYHWAEDVAPRPVIVEVPPRIDLPLVGQCIKFERTLIEPDDVPEVRADYREITKGAR